MSATNDGSGTGDGAPSTRVSLSPKRDRGGGDELARLKHQVAALRVTSAPVAAPKRSPQGPHRNKKKNDALFGYWKETSTAEGKSAPPPMKTPTTTPGASSKKPLSASASHSFTPTSTFALPPPLGRPPGPDGVRKAEFRPTAAQYDHSDGDSVATGGASSQRSGSRGWNPEADIRRGSVAKFTQMFGTKDDAEADSASIASSSVRSSVSPPKERRTWEPPKPPPPTRGAHGETWAPDREIDSNRMSSIKAMWGAKTGGDSAGGKSGIPPLPYRRPSAAGAKPSSAAVVGGAVVVGGAAAASSSIGNDADAHDARDERSAADDAGEDAGGDGYDNAADGASEGTSLDEKLVVWEEILELVRDVLPDKVDHVDDLLAQFNGRETKLRDALRGMRDRAVSITSSSREEEEEEEEDAGYAVPAATPDGSAEEPPNVDYESLTTLSDEEKDTMQFEYIHNDRSDLPYEDMNRMVVDALGAEGTPAVATSPDDYLDDDGDFIEVVDNARVTEELMLTDVDTDDVPMSPNSQKLSPADASAPQTPQASNRTASAVAAVRSPPITSPGNSRGSATTHDGAHSVNVGSLEDGTIASEESRHVSFMDHSGVALDRGPLPEVLDDSQRSDPFTGKSYVYSENRRSSSSGIDADDDAAGADDRPKGNDGPDTGRKQGLPLVNAGDTNGDGWRRGSKTKSDASFETFHIGQAVPSVGVPATVGLLKNKGAPSVVSELQSEMISVAPGRPPATPAAARRPTPWHEKQRTRWIGCAALLLLAACGAALGLFFSGALMGDKDNDPVPKADMSLAATAQPAPAPVTPAVVVASTGSPSLSPLASPSGTPTAAPITSCTEMLRAQYRTLGLGRSPDDQAPNVAMDGTNAVAVTSSGGVRFYALEEGRDGVDTWVEVDYFPNINRYSLTPAAALSGDVAVVGFVYQVLGFNQGTGGAYVYERDPATGRWRREAVLTPNPEDGIDGTAKFGWSVDVDADRSEPLVVVGAHGENDKAGSVYVFRRTRPSRDRSVWSRAGKVFPGFCPVGDYEFNFGYAVAVSGNVIAASTDCDFIVQLNTINETLNGVETFQDIRYIDFELGAISSLVMDERHLVYSTVYGGVAIYELGRGNEFEFLELLDFSENQEILSYPLAIDRDILAVGVGNEYWVFPKEDGVWKEGAFTIRNGDADALGVPSVAVGGRTVLAGSGDPHDVYHYDISGCANAMPTGSPTRSGAPTAFWTWPPSPGPTTVTPTAAPTTGRPSASPTRSSVPTPSTPMPTAGSSPRPSHSSAPTPDMATRGPTTTPSLLLTASPSAGPVVASTSPSLAPTRSPTALPTLPPSTSPTQQAVASSPPTASAASSCHLTEIIILYDSSPFGLGYVLTRTGPAGGKSNVDTYFVPFDTDLANQRSVKSLCLEGGSYTFTMYDSYGDGLCCANGDGEYILVSEGKTLVQGGEFGFSEEASFVLPASL